MSNDYTIHWHHVEKTWIRQEVEISPISEKERVLELDLILLKMKLTAAKCSPKQIAEALEAQKVFARSGQYRPSYIKPVIDYDAEQEIVKQALLDLGLWVA